MDLGWLTFWKVFLKTYLSFEAKGAPGRCIIEGGIRPPTSTRRWAKALSDVHLAESVQPTLDGYRILAVPKS